MASVTVSLSPPLTSLFPSSPKPLSIFTLSLPSGADFLCLQSPSRRRRLALPLAAVADDSLPPPAALQKAQQIVPAALDDGASSRVISALLFVAFIGLSLLTIGVIYLAVQDFLQKREKDKFEEEEAKKKKGKKKTKVRARAGPKGFGQKVEDDDD